MVKLIFLFISICLFSLPVYSDPSLGDGFRVRVRVGVYNDGFRGGAFLNRNEIIVVLERVTNSRGVNFYRVQKVSPQETRTFLVSADRINDRGNFTSTTSEAITTAFRLFRSNDEDCDDSTTRGQPVNPAPVVATPTVGETTPTPTATPRVVTSPLDGAKKIMASMYQSCLALNGEMTKDSDFTNHLPISRGKRAMTDTKIGKTKKSRRDNYTDWHYILSRLKTEKTAGRYPDSSHGCSDMTLKPVAYGYGAKPVTQGNELKVLRNLASPGGPNGCPASGYHCPAPGVESDPVVGLDCSGFVYAAYQAAGLRFSTSSDEEDIGNFGTWRLGDLMAGSTCVGHAHVTKDQQLRPGDLINLGGKHVVMVAEPVGSDPFGIGTKKADGKCRDIDLDDMDFHIKHSPGDTMGSPGPSSAHINVYDKNASLRNGRFAQAIVNFAIELCQNGSLNSSAQAPRFGIIRHKSQEVDSRGNPVTVPAGCTRTPRSVEGEECVNHCL